MKRFLFWNRSSESRKASPAGDPADASGLLTGDPAEDEQSLRILLETIAGVSFSMDLDEVLDDIVDKTLHVTQAERAIMLLGEDAGDLTIRTARDSRRGELGSDLQYSRGIVRRCVEEGQAVRSVVQSDREALELGQSVYDLKLRAVMCAPLIAKDRIVGAIYVDSRATRREFSSRDLALFDALSAQLAMAVENARLHADSLEKARLEKDVEIARSIQQHLLSPVPEKVAGLDVAARYLPCESASGDTYDFIQLGARKLAILIGDVTGHGVGAALVTHTAQSAVRSYLELIDDLSQVTTRLNNRLVAGVETGNFMSLLLALIDVEAGTLHYVNAGHSDLLHVTAAGLQRHGKTGMVLGVVGDSEYPVRGPIPLVAGDLLVMSTDGVEEAVDEEREMFGEERLHDVVGACRDLPAGEVLERIHRAVDEHTGGAPQQDDVTMIAIRVLSG